MVIVKLEFMTTNSLIHNFGQCARIGVRFGPLFSSIIVNPIIIFKVMPIFCFMVCTNISICLTVLEEGLINRNIAREVFKLLEEEIPVFIFSYPVGFPMYFSSEIHDHVLTHSYIYVFPPLIKFGKDLNSFC